jgi:hypothetical protein
VFGWCGLRVAKPRVVFHINPTSWRGPRAKASGPRHASNASVDALVEKSASHRVGVLLVVAGLLVVAEARVVSTSIQPVGEARERKRAGRDTRRVVARL